MRFHFYCFPFTSFADERWLHIIYDNAIENREFTAGFGYADM